MMVDQSRVSLTWDAYEKNICNGLGLLQQRGEFVDMTLAADGYHVKVHQLVLSLVSPYIKDLIKAANCPHPVIFLNKVSYDTLHSILEYAYTGEAVVDPERLDCFLEACKELHITGLQDVTTKGHNKKKKPLTRSDAPNEVHQIYLASPVTSRKRRRTEKARETLESIHSDEANDETNDQRSDEEAYDDEDADATYQPDDEEEKQKITFNENKMNIEYLRYDNDDYEDIEPYRAGSRWVCRDEHYYVAQRSKGQSIYFRCATSSCPARWKLSITAGAGPLVGEHDHEPTHWVRSRNSMFQALKRRTKNETTQLNVIYEQEAAKYQDAIPYLSYESVAPSMRKWRQAVKLSLEQSLASTG